MNSLLERRYQVFVSSTFKDLAAERESVLQAILSARAFPSGMELFPANNDEQLKFIEQEISSSDIYLVIVAGRYGSTDDQGVSYTEREYDYAVAQKKYIITFVVDDLDSLPSRFTEKDDVARRKLVAFREKVMKRRMVRKYSSAEELRSNVLSALYRAFAVLETAGWVRGENARRLEDLETVNNLRLEIESLKKENAALKNRPEENGTSHQFLDTEFHKELALIQYGQGESPDLLVKLKLKWRVLLGLCTFFEEARVEERDVEYRLTAWVAHEASQQYSRDFTNLHASGIRGLGPLLSNIRSRFIAAGLLKLSFVEVEKSDFFDRATVRKEMKTYWYLTEPGHAVVSDIDELDFPILRKTLYY